MGYDPRLCLLSNFVSAADGDFYKEIIKSAITLRAEYFRNMPVNSQLLWKNDNVKINKTTIYWRRFLEVGIVTAGDLFDSKSKVKPYEFWVEKGLDKKYFYNWYSLVTLSLSKRWNYDRVQKDNPFTFSFMFENNKYSLENTSSKIIYSCIKAEFVSNSVVESKICKYFSVTSLDSTYFNKVYLLPKLIFTDIKTQMFQYNFLQNILVNNYWLEKWKY